MRALPSPFRRYYMSEELITQFEKIAKTITTLHELFHDQIQEVKKQQEQQRKDIESLYFYMVRIEQKINKKEGD